MGDNSINRALAISQKVYGWLLRAYPKAHRAAYGSAMAQLFRDQCRDAWKEEEGRGVFKLWLRVLPDLLSTSITERIAALHEKKSRTDKLANMSRFRGATPFAMFGSIFVVVFLIVFLASLAITFLLPETYASTARIVVTYSPQAEFPSAIMAGGYDPYFLQTTFEIIQSEDVLKRVVEKLNLNEQWGKVYNNGRTLKTTDTLAMLRHRISLGKIRNSRYITIAAYSADMKQAAEIANAVAQSYKDYRLNLDMETQAKAHKILEAKYDQQEGQIQQVQTEVESLRMKVNFATNSDPSQSPQEQAYWDKRHDLNQLTEQQKVLAAQMHSYNGSLPVSAVTITDQAEPSRTPYRPTKPLNIVLGALTGVFLGAIAGGAVVATHFKRRSTVNPAKA